MARSRPPIDNPNRFESVGTNAADLITSARKVREDHPEFSEWECEWGTAVVAVCRAIHMSMEGVRRAVVDKSGRIDVHPSLTTSQTNKLVDAIREGFASWAKTT